MTDGTLYGCCACIGSIGIGFLPPLVTMLSQKGIAVNFYFDGETATLTPKGKKLCFITETEYPYVDTVRMTVNSQCDEEFTLSLRIPEWSEKTLLKVNGEAVSVNAGYTDVTRVWRKGDRIEIVFDLRVKRIDPPSDSDYRNDYVALRRGCIILASDARLGYDPNEFVDVAFDADGCVEATCVSDAAIPDCELMLSVLQRNGMSIKLVDYASAGKTWDEKSLYAAWMPLKNKK